MANDDRTLLAAIVESSDDAIISKDLSGRVTSWNAGAERLFGYRAAEMLGKPIARLIPSERAEEEARILARIRRGQRVDHYHSVRRCKDGRLVQVSLTLSPLRDAAGKIIGAANVMRDVTKLVQHQQELLESEARTRAIVTTAVDAIVTIDDRGTIDSCNPATERLFGYSAAEMVARNIKTLMPQPYRAEHDGYLRNYMRTGQAHIIGVGREVMGQRKDGGIFPLALAVSEVHFGGTRRMFTGIMHDLTSRRQLERQILETATAEQQRIGQDLHDGLCQELVSLSMGAEILARKLDQGADPRITVAEAERLGEGLHAATDQARRLAHGLNPLDVESGGLPGALEQLVRRVSESAHVACRLRWDGRACPRDGSVATHLYRISQEAISNALRHGKATHITVDLRSNGLSNGRARRASGLTLSIADDGCGLQASVPVKSDDHGKPRLRPVRHHAEALAEGGGGIGLQTMSYRAKLIGGTLDVRPGPRGGTVVICTVMQLDSVVATKEAQRPPGPRPG